MEMHQDSQSSNTHSMLIGYLLWIFGFTGSHRFYYGYTISGIIYFFTFGLLGIGWLVDIFLIPGMDRKADLHYKAGLCDYNVAWLLLGFLGVFGAHRLYMGKFLTAILYFFTGGFLLVGWLYDLCTLNSQVHEINSSATLGG